MILVAALATESYWMSRHDGVASAREEMVLQTVPLDIVPPARPPAEAAVCSPAAFDQAERTLTALASAPSMAQVPLGELKSNPFQHNDAAPAGGAGTGAPARTRPQDDRAEVLNAVASLELESVAVGETHRSCSINNTACEEGQQIDGFTVETIAKGSVTVSKGIYRLN